MKQLLNQGLSASPSRAHPCIRSAYLPNRAPRLASESLRFDSGSVSWCARPIPASAGVQVARRSFAALCPRRWARRFCRAKGIPGTQRLPPDLSLAAAMLSVEAPATVRREWSTIELRPFRSRRCSRSQRSEMSSVRFKASERPSFRPNKSLWPCAAFVDAQSIAPGHLNSPWISRRSFWRV
jgi:hypothetical protein